MASAPPKSSALLHKLVHPDSDHALVIDDDGRVCYAYLMAGDRIVGDVWLYNRAPAPKSPGWTTGKRPPFLNPRDLAAARSVTPIASPGELRAEWIVSAGTLRQARVFVRGELWAVLAPGMKPGWSIHAKAAGPVAVPLSELPRQDQT